MDENMAIYIHCLAGEVIEDSGFTLSRPFKRRKPRSGSNVTADTSAGHAPTSSSHDAHMMQLLSDTKSRSDTKESLSSTDM